MNHESPMSRRTFVRGALGVLTLPLLGCGDATGPSTDPHLSARPGTPGSTPDAGMNQLGLASPRDGYFYVPPSYTGEQAVPLFIALHGAGGNALNWQSYPARADAHGFVLLAIDSRAPTWDFVQGTYGPDVRFLDDALARTFDHCRIDPNRIALGGFSDGASYALSLGVSNGDLFSHLVGFSPGFFSPGGPIVGLPRVYVSHGRQDRILPYAGTQSHLVPFLREAGYDVTFESFDGDHTVPAEISESALEWFLA